MDNPNAYPGTMYYNNHSISHPGMTLRDWFAGQALDWAALSTFSNHRAKDVAGRAYELADAMLAERSKADPA